MENIVQGHHQPTDRVSYWPVGPKYYEIPNEYGGQMGKKDWSCCNCIKKGNSFNVNIETVSQSSAMSSQYSKMIRAKRGL